LLKNFFSQKDKEIQLDESNELKENASAAHNNPGGHGSYMNEYQKENSLDSELMTPTRSMSHYGAVGNF